MERPPPRAFRVPLSRRIAVAIAIGSGGACARSARAPDVPLSVALERAEQALCTAGGVESPRALVAALVPAAPCPAGDPAARVRCYLAQPDTTVQVARVAGGVRIRLAIPQLSDHVHDVTVRRRGDRLVIEIDSRN
jgi:hypothetical protein